MFDRRGLFSFSSAVGAALASFLKWPRARASESKDFKFIDVEKRGTRGMLERLPTLDLESSQDFLTGFRNLVNRDMRSLARKRFDDLLAKRGIGPDDILSLEEIIAMAESDHLIMTSVRSWV